MTPATERLWAAIEERQDELTELVAELVRRPSLLGQEADAQAFVAGYLRESDLPTDVWEVDDAILALPNAGTSGVPFAGRPNVAGTLRGVGDGRSLILNGHIDVVSAEPISDWTHDPWGAEIVGKMMYGRGTGDMKSGIALNLFLARLIRDLGIPLRGDLIVQSVIEEECTGNGALDASRRYHADAALVTEPSNGSFTWAHSGILWFRVAVAGKSAHGAVAYTGVNAIVKTYLIINALLALEEQLNLTTHPAFEGAEHPINLIVGVIQGGDWPSMVPGFCHIHCRLNFHLGQSVAETRAMIEATVRQAAMSDEWLRNHPPVVTYDGFQSSGSTVSLDEPWIRMLGAWHERVAGVPLPPKAVNAITDQRYFNFAGIPSGCYGATGGNFHAADEWLDLTSLVPAAKVIGGFLVEWCGVAE